MYCQACDKEFGSVHSRCPECKGWLRTKSNSGRLNGVAAASGGLAAPSGGLAATSGGLAATSGGLAAPRTGPAGSPPRPASLGPAAQPIGESPFPTRNDSPTQEFSLPTAGTSRNSSPSQEFSLTGSNANPFDPPRFPESTTNPFDESPFAPAPGAFENSPFPSDSNPFATSPEFPVAAASNPFESPATSAFDPPRPSSPSQEFTMPTFTPARPDSPSAEIRLGLGWEPPPAPAEPEPAPPTIGERSRLGPLPVASTALQWSPPDPAPPLPPPPPPPAEVPEVLHQDTTSTQLREEAEVQSRKLAYYVVAGLLLCLGIFSAYLWMQNRRLKTPPKTNTAQARASSVKLGKDYLNKGKAAFKKGKFESAQSNAELALNLLNGPGSEADLKDARSFYQQSTLRWAQQLLEQARKTRETNRIISLCQQSLSMYKKLPKTEKQQAQVLALEASSYSRIGDSANAFSFYQKAHALNPNGGYRALAEQERTTQSPPESDPLPPPEQPRLDDGPRYPSGRPGAPAPRTQTSAPNPPPDPGPAPARPPQAHSSAPSTVYVEPPRRHRRTSSKPGGQLPTY